MKVMFHWLRDKLNSDCLKNEVEITSSGIKIVKVNKELIKQGLKELNKNKESNSMKIKKLKHNAVIPQYQSKGASGFDFHSTEDIVVMPGETAMISTGLAFQIPTGKEIQVRPRSGLSAKTKIRVSNSPGTIDCDYQGEVKILLDNIGLMPYTVKIGDRIAQGIVTDVQQVTFEVVDEFETKTERGDKGFGSSGV